MIKFERADRLNQLPPYLFLEVDRKKRAAIAAGHDVIDLGIGDPDEPTPKFIVDALTEAAQISEYHRYPMDAGLPEFRQEIAKWFNNRFNVNLSTDNQILPVIGSKEAIGHLPLAFINPGDYALIPEPGYPPYRSGTVFAGGIPYLMPLKVENGFLPDLKAIPEDVAKKAKVIFVNYPNNPTAALASDEFYKELIEFAHKYNILVCADAAYSEVFYETPSPSFLQYDGAMECGIEFHSLSKMFNMTGWRIGFAVGNPEALGFLLNVKSNLDSGCFFAVQKAAAVAMRDGEQALNDVRSLYTHRRNLFCDALKSAGWNPRVPPATFYVWTEVPNGQSSLEFSTRILEELNIVATPGHGFGPSGEGFIRMSLTIATDRLAEAAERLKNMKV